MSAAGSSTKAVVTALAANSFVTIIKLIAFVLSGSGAMLSEAIHSAADTGNQALLWMGLRRGDREADDRFQYGYGGERFIFGILSATGIFFIGCGVTVYHGVSSLLDPHLPTLSVWTFAVLGLALVIEGAVLVLAIRLLASQRGELSFFRYVRERGDPATVAILLEDGAAVLGLVLAGVGIVLTYLTGNPIFDALASIVVGLLLGAIAIYLVFQNRGLLLGRAVPVGVEDQFTEILLRRPSVRDVHDVKTRQLTHDVYTLKAEIVLDEDYLAKLLDKALPSGLGTDRTHRGRDLNRVATAAIHAISCEIQVMERDVRAEIPQARHIDIEISDPEPDPPPES